MNLALFEPNAPPLAEGERFRVDQLDAVEWLRGLPSSSIDLLVTDPAYESLEKHRAKGTTTRLKVSAASSNQWFPIFPNGRFPEFFAEAWRVLKENTHLYVLCDQETMFHIKPLGEAVGFKFWKPIAWHKGTIGMGYHYRALYEVVLFFEKGKRALKNLGTADVISILDEDETKAAAEVIKIPRVRNGYPTEKPEELLRIFIEQSSAPGEIVADPFTGSGSTGAAALHLKRRFVGTDLVSAAVARQRLEGVVA